jgi:nucleotide-binding universal stress UspA family protein
LTPIKVALPAPREVAGGGAAMSFRNVMVQVDSAPTADARVAYARSVAERFGGRLIGVAVGRFPGDRDLLFASAAEVERQRQELADRLVAAEQRFFAGLAGAGIELDWRAGVDEKGRLLARWCRAADVVVLDRPQPQHFDTMLGVDLTGVLVAAARPVLFVPPAAGRLQCDRVVIGWKDTREARRAVHDALPILKEADEAVVLAVGEEASLDDAEDVTIYLRRHEVPARAAHRDGSEGELASLLLEAAHDIGAGLLVAGGYGHNRMVEWVWGGVTDDLLRTATLPCLLSH